MKRLILVLTLVWLLVVVADYDAGLAAYERDDYATALEEWRPLAQQGVSAAQFNLGLLYYHGDLLSNLVFRG